jgi:hypothetical protein
MPADGSERADDPEVAPGAVVSDGSPLVPVCPYLRRLTDEGRLGEPASTVDAVHHCAAVPDSPALSDRQQALVCLTPSYGDCPRYLRATLVIPVGAVQVERQRRIPAATIAASLLLAISAIASVGFVVANGGISMPVAAVTPRPSPTDVALASPTPSVGPTPQPTAAVSPSPDVSPTAAASPSPSPEEPSPSPSPIPSATPAGSPPPSPSPTSDRYALLVPCPDQAGCYIYTVRRGDNFTSIGLYFGVPFETLLDWNPHVDDPATIQPGVRLRMPPPTR